MDNALNFLEHSMGALIFILALHLLILLRNDVNGLITSTKETVSETNVLYGAEVDDIQDTDELISYTDLCAVLARPLDYDIEVIGTSNTVTYQKDTYNYLMFDFTDIPSADYYKRVYQYDVDAVINKIQYEAVN